MIDAGIDTSGDPAPLNFTDDIDGDTRPQGSGWDIGADEYVVNDDTNISLADSCYGSDALELSTVIPLTDTGVMPEALSLAIQAMLTEGLQGDDSCILQAGFALEDPYLGTDALSTVIRAAVTETSLGSELLALGIDVRVLDDGKGPEVLTIEVPVSLADSAAATEAVSAALAQLLGKLSENLGIRFISIERTLGSKTSHRDIRSRSRTREVKP